MKPILAILLLVVATVSGCAGMRLIDSEVQALSTLPPHAPAIQGNYRFDRLPLQNTPEVQAEAQRMEALAQTALARYGLRRDDAQVRYGVQLGARLQTRERPRPGGQLPFHRTSGDWAGHGFISLGGPGSSLGVGMSFPPTYLYLYELSILIRDLASGQVVFESRASHEGPWADSGTVLAALFEAALQDFPAPPAGVRKINIEIPR